MKRITIALLATAAILTVASARADTRFSIGVNIGVPTYRPAPPTVVYAPPPAVVVAPARGYWKGRRGQDLGARTLGGFARSLGPARAALRTGYYAYRTERVWVETHERGPAGRAYAYGYDNRRDDRDGWKR
jgi:hypothetical protein